MIKKIYSYIIALSCVLFFTSIYSTYFKYSFNTENVVSNIEYLSSDFFKGRLPGTLENEAASNFVREKFIENNVSPLSESYFQCFKAKSPFRTVGVPYLKVLDGNNSLIKEYDYGTDFKEDLLNFKNNKISFNLKDKVLCKKDAIQVSKENDLFLFYITKNNKLDFRSSFIHDAPHSMYIILNNKCFEEINDFLSKGFSVDCFIPYETKETTLKNVVGVIQGKNPTAPPLVLSAHFDHIGTDLAGNIYSGSLDNASGTAFLIELTSYISSLGKPSKNIIIAGFNAEEYGLLGSKAFVELNKKILDSAKVINFDMIGSSTNVPLTIMAGKKDTKDTPLVKEASNICSKNKLDFNYMFEESSDHGSFRTNNIQAITFCDADTSKIHSPKDKANFIDSKSIDRCFSVASKEILNNCYDENIIVYYSQYISIVSFFILLISVLKANENSF